MARLKDLEVEVLGQTRKFPLKCSTSGVFSTDWPGVITERVRIVTQGFATLEQLTKAIYDAAATVNAINETYKDFIVFDWSTQRFNHNERAEGCGINLKYKAVREWVTGQKVEYSEIEIESAMFVFDYDRSKGEKGAKTVSISIDEILHDFGDGKYLVVKKNRDRSNHGYNNRLNWGSKDRIEFTFESYMNLKKLHDNMLKLGDSIKGVLEKAKELNTLSSIKLLPNEGQETKD